MLFGCDLLCARKYSQKSFWSGQGGEKETGEKKGHVACAYNVWLRECKLDASYSYFMPVESDKFENDKGGNAIFVIWQFYLIARRYHQKPK